MAKVSELMSENISNSVANQETWGNILYNVKKYGAIGDGITDDTVEVQKAIDTAIENNAKLVYFPQGSYKVTALNNLDQVILMGDNAVFVGITNTILQFGTVRVDGYLDDMVDVDTSTVLPQTGESLIFDGTKWKAGSGGDRVTTSTTNGNIKVNNVEKTVYTHPTEHPASMIAQDSTHKFITDAEKTNWNSKAAGTHGHSVSDITGLSTVATSGSYTDLADTPIIPTVINDLSDVDTVGGTTGQVLTLQPDSTWKPQTPTGSDGGATTLDGLTDVDTSTIPPTEGQSLVYLSGLWKPSTVGGTADNITIADTNNHFTSTNVEGALEELFTNVSDGKVQVRDAVTGKGGTVTDADGDGVPTFSELSAGVNSIAKGQGTATEPQVLSGVTFSNSDGVLRTGTMANNGAGGTVTPTTGNVTKPAGYYSSAITITGDSDLTAANIKNGVNLFGVVGTNGYGAVTAGTNQLVNHATVANINTTDNVAYGKKLKEVRVNLTGGIRVAFTMDQNNSIGGGTRAKIYVNGVARGLERSGSTGSDSSPVTYTEDITINSGDLVQIYGYAVNSSYSATLYDMKISIAESNPYAIINV